MDEFTLRGRALRIVARLRVVAALAALLVAPAAPASAAAEGPHLPPELARAAADYDRAQIAGDGAELRRLLADDYELVNGACELFDKAGFIADSTAPGSKLQPFVVEHPINRIWPDGAVLSGEVHLQGVSDGKPFDVRTRFADVWRKRDGRWQVVFTQVTRFPLGAGAKALGS